MYKIIFSLTLLCIFSSVMASESRIHINTPAISFSPKLELYVYPGNENPDGMTVPTGCSQIWNYDHYTISCTSLPEGSSTFTLGTRGSYWTLHGVNGKIASFTSNKVTHCYDSKSLTGEYLLTATDQGDTHCSFELSFIA